MLNPFAAFRPGRRPLRALWTPAALVALVGGHWAGGYDPASGRLFQDAAGTVPALNPGDPVGLIRRAAGTVDGAQPVALSRPTLARWPRGGLRNLLRETLFAQATGRPATTISLTAEVLTVTRTSTGVANEGAALATVGSDMTFSAGQRYSIQARVKPGANGAGIQFTAGMQVLVEANGAVSAGSLYSAFAGATGTVVKSTPLGDGWFLVSISATATTATTIGAAILWLWGGRNSSAPIGASAQYAAPQIELAASPTAYQRVASAFDVTEAGVPGVWHLWNDGGDSLPVTLPAGSYGRARVNTSGEITLDTVVNPTDLLTGTRQVEMLLRPGALTPAEEAQIRAYWGPIYG